MSPARRPAEPATSDLRDPLRASAREEGADGEGASSGRSPHAPDRVHVRGRPTYRSRPALDAANSRLRAALAKLAAHPDAEVQAVGDRVGAEVAAVLDKAGEVAEQAHPPTRDRLARLARKAERIRAAADHRQAKGGA